MTFSLDSFFSNSSNVISSGSFSKCHLLKLESSYFCIKLHKQKLPKVIHEFIIAKSLQHPNILYTFDLILHPNYYFSIHSYYNSKDLFDFISSPSPTSFPVINCIFTQIIHAILYIHSNHIAHLDLKPENILFQNNTIKIIDFGSSFSSYSNHFYKNFTNFNITHIIDSSHVPNLIHPNNSIIHPNNSTIHPNNSIIHPINTIIHPINTTPSYPIKSCLSPTIIPNSIFSEHSCTSLNSHSTEKSFASLNSNSTEISFASLNSYSTEHSSASLSSCNSIDSTIHSSSFAYSFSKSIDSNTYSLQSCTSASSTDSITTSAPSLEFPKFSDSSVMCTGQNGSDPYMSPECFSDNPYDGTKVDIWACAIIYLTMVYKRFPWEKAILSDSLFRDFSSCPVEFQFFENLPETEKKLLGKMLSLDAFSRIDSKRCWNEYARNLLCKQPCSHNKQ